MSSPPSTDPSGTPEAPEASPGRLRSAWMVLRGQAIVPDTIRAEWAAYRFELEGILDQLGRTVGRMTARTAADLRAKVKELEAELAGRPSQTELPLQEQGGPDPRWAAKAALYRRGGGGAVRNGRPESEESSA